MLHIFSTIECPSICEYISGKMKLDPTLHIILWREDISDATSSREYIQWSKYHRLSISRKTRYDTGITRILTELERVGSDFFLTDGMGLDGLGFHLSPE